MSALIYGGTGAVGSVLVQAFRNSSRFSWLPPGGQKFIALLVINSNNGISYQARKN
jgi:hypothetical protein